jgi:hypothetical protein
MIAYGSVKFQTVQSYDINNFCYTVICMITDGGEWYPNVNIVKVREYQDNRNTVNRMITVEGH